MFKSLSASGFSTSRFTFYSNRYSIRAVSLSLWLQSFIAPVVRTALMSYFIGGYLRQFGSHSKTPKADCALVTRTKHH